VFTDWYPQATLSPIMRNPDDGSIALRDGAIAWCQVTVSPGTAPEFPASQGGSHYYAARAVEAAPLRVGQDQERFLFYRGVGRFVLPLSSLLTANGDFEVQNLGSTRLGPLRFRVMTSLVQRCAAHPGRGPCPGKYRQI
jgi:hypothetical protein